MNNSRQHSAAYYAIHAALTTPVLAACFTFSPLAPHLPQAYAQTQEAPSNISNTSSVVNTNANPAIKSQQSTRNAPEPDERVASITDSDARKWSGIDGSRYGDSIRKTSRVTYTDAGKPLSVSCDVTGDNRPDMIFVDEAQQKIHVVDHIPYGSDKDDVVKSINEQQKAAHISLPAKDDPSDTWKVSCVKTKRGETATLAIANGKKVLIEKTNSIVPEDPSQSAAANSTSAQAQEFVVSSTLTFSDNVYAITSATSAFDVPGMYVAAGKKVYWYESIPKSDTNGAKATKVWELAENDLSNGSDPTAQSAPRVTLAPLNYAIGEDQTVGIGLPHLNKVYAIPVSAESGSADEAGTVIYGTEGGFGTSMVAMSDINDDDCDDFAIGAPFANGNTGAVAVIFGNKEAHGDIHVQTSSTSENTVMRGQEHAGTLIRQTDRGRIGMTLGYIPAYDPDNKGALVIARPDHEEHPGAVIVSEAALLENHNSGLGLDGVPSNQSTFLASEEGEGDAGYFVGVLPPSDSDSQLSTMYTADTQGKVDVWTADMRRQHQTTPPAKPLYPEPPAPSAEPAYTPVNEADQKSWLGEFTSGLGGALAQATGDVTGDGKPDIVSGNAIRSEYKFDPFYEDSTPTHGWVFNVTGEIQIIPGGTQGGTKGTTIADNKDVITIKGPQKTDNPATDSAMGFSVAIIGDVNGDGIDDIAATSVTTGKVWVIYGGKDLAKTNLNQLTPDRGYVIEMPSDAGGAGYQVTRVGDFDGDGLADVGFVVANTPYAMGRKEASYGTAYILKGNKDGRNINLKDLEAAHADVLWTVKTPKNHTLSSFTQVGDVNGDGIADYVLTDFNTLTTQGHIPGKAWVVYGSKEHKPVDLENTLSDSVNAASATRSADAMSSVVTNASSNDSGKPSVGYELSMPNNASWRLGAGNSVANVGDVNSDGLDDFVIGFDGGTISEQRNGGVALVLGTKDTPKQRVIDPENVQKNDSAIYVLTGKAQESSFGWAVAALPQSKNNPDALLAIGAGREDQNGTAYILRVKDIPQGVTAINKLGNKVGVIRDDGERARFGRSLAFVGDFLGKPTLAIGGDGVIDDPLSGQEGYAHSAHVLAVAIDRVLPREASDDTTNEHNGEENSDSHASNTNHNHHEAAHFKRETSMQHTPQTSDALNFSAWICEAFGMLGAGLGFARKHAKKHAKK